MMPSDTEGREATVIRWPSWPGHDVGTADHRPQERFLDHDEEPVIALAQQAQAVGADVCGLVGVVGQVRAGWRWRARIAFV